MRKLIKLAIIAIAIRLFFRWWNRRQAGTDDWTTADTGTDPADELRRKLAETRDDEVAAEPSAPVEGSVADRRAEVHEQGRAALNEMKSSDES